MTSTEIRTSPRIADQRRDFVERQILLLLDETSGVEYFEMLHRLRARGAQLGGAEKWDRVLRWIDSALDRQATEQAGPTNRVIVIMALSKFKEAVEFPRV